MQYPLVIVVKVHLKKGKAVGSEEGKGLGSGPCYEHRKETERGFYGV
jgi:hypothetical protein